MSVYVPHGREVGQWHYEYKLAFLDALRRRAAWLANGDTHLVLGGDVNVAPTDSDVFHPDAFVGLTHVTEPERHALTRGVAGGLQPTHRRGWQKSAGSGHVMPATGS